MEYTTYQIIFELTRARRIRIGKLGRFLFPEGIYTYTGSAKRNLEARIGRHLSQEKKLRWHIDYLLNTDSVYITRVRRSKKNECLLNQRTPGEIVVPKFGASDCKNGCVSHLKWRPKKKS